MSSEIMTILLLFFPTQMPFISLSYLIVLARTSSATVNKSSESRHVYLVLDLRGNAFTFSLLSDTNCKSVVYDLYYIELCTLYTQCVEGFYYERLLCFVGCFSASFKMVVSFLTCTQLNVVFHIFDSCMLNFSCPRNKSHLKMVNNRLFNLICLYFAENSCCYIHQGY